MAKKNEVAEATRIQGIKKDNHSLRVRNGILEKKLKEITDKTNERIRSLTEENSSLNARIVKKEEAIHQMGGHIERVGEKFKDMERRFTRIQNRMKQDATAIDWYRNMAEEARGNAGKIFSALERTTNALDETNSTLLHLFTSFVEGHMAYEDKDMDDPFTLGENRVLHGDVKLNVVLRLFQYINDKVIEYPEKLPSMDWINKQVDLIPKKGEKYGEVQDRI